MHIEQFVFYGQRSLDRFIPADHNRRQSKLRFAIIKMYFCKMTHEKFMQRCLDLAKNGLGTTYPNPLVGSVIVVDNQIIGEGWHKKAGEAHAEINAINSVAHVSLLERATIYVNLEPCSHFGKTPPCVDAIIKHKIPKVVIGSSDPNPLVAGKGIQKLVEAGINVEVGVLDQQCLVLNRRFFTSQTKNRPFIILKWAESADGFVAPIKTEKKSLGAPVWISNKLSQQWVHKWRTEEQAILIGTKTALEDNPQLTSRSYFGNNPIRIVIDRLQKIPKENYIFDNQSKTILLSESENTNEGVVSEKIDFSQNVAQQIVEVLQRNSIISVIIEGGTKTLQTFIDADLWDEARVFKSVNHLGSGVTSPVFNFAPTKIQNSGGDKLLIFER